VARARIWYQRAAEKGNVKAMHNLAVLSAGGDQASADYTTAVKWFAAAAERGLADSQYNLAVLYESGLGVPQSRIQAYKWYSLSAKAGDKDATARCDAMKEELSKEDLAAANEMVKAFSTKAIDALVNDAHTAGEDWKKRARSETSG
jgi:localization factor PodJL